jgi:hypothetical protein
MANDALDPGPDGSYPHWPRKPDGTSDRVRMPTGKHRQKVKGTHRRVVVDLTMRHPDGTPIVPPTIPPGGTP